MAAKRSSSRAGTDTSGTTTLQVVVAAEAIVVVDLIESTRTSDLFGWYAVGRELTRTLREEIYRLRESYDLRCVKSTGDGYLLSFGHADAAELAAVDALDACVRLLKTFARRNRRVPEEKAINLRFAVHFGQVDVVDNDREGPNVSYAFRIEGINQKMLPEAITPMKPEAFPTQNYILCSEQVGEILQRRSKRHELISIGLLRLKGFSHYHEIFLVKQKTSRK